jgi:hypothetical protein
MRFHRPSRESKINNSTLFPLLEKTKNLTYENTDKTRLLKLTAAPFMPNLKGSIAKAVIIWK